MYCVQVAAEEKTEEQPAAAEVSSETKSEEPATESAPATEQVSPFDVLKLEIIL
jgi:hypothetical protein